MMLQFNVTAQVPFWVIPRKIHFKCGSATWKGGYRPMGVPLCENLAYQHARESNGTSNGRPISNTIAIYPCIHCTDWTVLSYTMKTLKRESASFNRLDPADRPSGPTAWAWKPRGFSWVQFFP
eukprot:6604636-Pyramimonas_sp.AAC.1